MRAIRVHEVGGAEVLRLDDVPVPDPGDGEVRVRVRAAGVNFIDIYHRTGLYPMPLPFTPGQEAAGEIDAVGPGVTDFRAGQRVAYASVSGSYRDFAIVPQRMLVGIPDNVSFELAAATMLQGMTAHYLAFSAFSLHPGHRCLVHAGAGGVGRLLVQIAKTMCGAIVYATAGTPEKADLARSAGADEVILYREQDFALEIERLTAGAKVDVVYDSVGQATFEKSLQCLRPRGMLVMFGQSSGAVPPVNLRMLATGGSLYLTRPTLHHYIATAAELRWRSGDLFSWIETGMLEVRIDSVFPLERAADAQRRLESRQSAGKVLLVP
jgi:NADPH2:quinone reductase